MTRHVLSWFCSYTWLHFGPSMLNPILRVLFQNCRFQCAPQLEPGEHYLLIYSNCLVLHCPSTSCKILQRSCRFIWWQGFAQAAAEEFNFWCSCVENGGLRLLRQEAPSAQITFSQNNQVPDQATPEAKKRVKLQDSGCTTKPATGFPM